LIVILSDKAETDIEDIGDWIARDKPLRAVTFMQELRRSCAGLADRPLRFELVDRFRRFGLRRRVHAPCLILYIVRGESVFILRVVHGARDIAALLTEDSWFD